MYQTWTDRYHAVLKYCLVRNSGVHKVTMVTDQRTSGLLISIQKCPERRHGAVAARGHSIFKRVRKDEVHKVTMVTEQYSVDFFIFFLACCLAR